MNLAEGRMALNNPGDLEGVLKQWPSLQSSCSVVLAPTLVTRLRALYDRCKEVEQREQTEGLGWRRVSNTGHGKKPKMGSGSDSDKQGFRWRDGATHQPSKPRDLQPPRQSTHTAHAPHAPHQRYVSKFTNSSTNMEGKILNQVILNKLNKFSEANYDDIKSFLQQILDSNEVEFLQEFMKLVFKKASMEKTFCPLYARMIFELRTEYPSLLKELQRLYSEYMRIFQDVQDSSEFVQKDQQDQQTREKMHRLGYSQFLAELTKLGCLETSDLESLYCLILKQVKEFGSLESNQPLVEEYMDCLLAMTRPFQTAQTMTLRRIRNEVGSICCPIMKTLLESLDSSPMSFPGISKKAKFACMNCVDIFTPPS